MENVVGMNAVKEVSNTADRIYYELDGEGDADSSTTPSRNVDHHRDQRHREIAVALPLINTLLWIDANEAKVSGIGREPKTFSLQTANSILAAVTMVPSVFVSSRAVFVAGAK
ncbi:hypothetical protein HN011_010401 [Eciton burchellii]|nr:hypothetical protein HN011_010401 [Eciton burchellii]